MKYIQISLGQNILIFIGWNLIYNLCFDPWSGRIKYIFNAYAISTMNINTFIGNYITYLCYLYTVLVWVLSDKHSRN